MLLPRVIPCLLKKEGALVKTVKYGAFKYIGDPVNTIQIFNELEVDELVLLDIEAAKKGFSPDFELIEKVASECFMPLTYGGGIKNLQEMKKIFSLGVEKIIIGSEAVKNPEFVRFAAQKFGSQSIVVSIDVKKMGQKYVVYGQSGREKSSFEASEFVALMEEMGAGELLLNRIELDGVMAGYDLELIKYLSQKTNLPVIANCGAGELKDLGRAWNAGASAMAAGSLFVYQNTNLAVLINFPTRSELKTLFFEEPKIYNLSKARYLKAKKDILAIDYQEMSEYGAWEDENFLLDLPNKFSLSVLVTIKNRVSGYVVASQKTNFCVIHRLSVSSTYQNMGVGTRLLKKLVEKAKKNKLNRIVAETLKTGRADSFYQKNGFIKMRQRELDQFLSLKDAHSREKTIKNSIVYCKDI